ncbi:hypothetical protein LOC67_13095 [Stieleria sp. JC731]|uniref:PulJ/GspJ family protein n=1 Tax=Pirellulaceae TaxID=2691357 RepID=UPI001E2CE32B|nr:hypothetical protein [Stieleria sp. JC731]MCC9601486.1 hypothetical protein [Stieleria sp. JC731]
MNQNRLNMNSFPSHRRIAKDGFTILEVLIALTASLLLMLGLARAYKLLGDKITERQSEMDLSVRLRDVSIRLRDELRRATCEMTPPAKVSAGEGYLVYHEGPFTDSTTILGSVPHPTPANTTYFPDSRVGDMDDFLAFTSRAKEGAPFMGFIPQGVLDAVRFIKGQMTAAEQSAYTNVSGTQLTPFYSEVAEIAYWVSPEWVRNADGSLYYENQVADTNGDYTYHPVYLDRNGDLLPDRLNLHRRVLLVRPDLNFTPAEMSIVNGTGVPATIPATWSVPTIPFLVRTASGLRVLPISDVSATNQAIFPNAVSINAPGLWQNTGTPAAQLLASPHWLTGLARIQQVMDLSISRVTDYWSTPATAAGTYATYGMPTAILKANSLAELTRPENRFAHVRIPHQVISASPGSSMPQLALCPPHPYLVAREFSPADLLDTTDPLTTVNGAPTTFPHQADATVGTAPGNAKYLDRYGRFTLKTFLRPEFNLADQVSDVGAGGTSLARVRRGGSDIIATDVVGFNIQIYDPSAPRFVWMGPDGQPGVAGVDDDVDGSVTDEADELGWPGSDDEVVTVNDPRIDEVFVGNGNRTPTNWNATPNRLFSRVDGGDFVDLGYMRLAGGPMRGLFQFDQTGSDISPVILPTTPAASTTNHVEEFVSPFSGFSADRITIDAPTPFGSQQSTFPVSWENSGRMVVRTAAATTHVSSFYQPVYDTWTDSYASDPFDQEGVAIGTTVTGFNYAVEVGGFNATAYTERRRTQANPSNGSPADNVTPRYVVQRRWSSLDGAYANPGQFFAQDAGKNQTINQRSADPIGITAPVPQPLRALKVSIRLNDLSAETIRQQTVIQEF